MSSLTYARWSSSVSNILADLEGVHNDLFTTRFFVLRLEEAFLNSSHDYILLDALATAVLTRYARSFTTGVRQRLDASKNAALSAPERALHERLLAIRDKHIAHPVNCFETHAIYVGCCPDEPTATRVTAVSTGTRTSIGLTVEDVIGLKTLCFRWLDHVGDLMRKEEASLLACAQQLTAAELLALPYGPVEPHDDPTKVRRR